MINNIGWWKLPLVSIWKLLLNIDCWCEDISQEFPLSLRDCSLSVGSCYRLEDVDGCCRLVEICRCLEVFGWLTSFRKLPFIIAGRLSLMVSVVSLIVSVVDRVGSIYCMPLRSVVVNGIWSKYALRFNNFCAWICFERYLNLEFCMLRSLTLNSFIGSKRYKTIQIFIRSWHASETCLQVWLQIRPDKGPNIK